jgi:hypothetical protein
MAGARGDRALDGRAWQRAVGAVTRQWAVAFAWTCVLELPVYVLIAGRLFRPRWTAVPVSLLANAVTHPALWFLFPRFDPPVAWLLSGESLVVIVEALLIAASARSHPLGRALPVGALASLLANSLSAGAGLLMEALG